MSDTLAVLVLARTLVKSERAVPFDALLQASFTPEYVRAAHVARWAAVAALRQASGSFVLHQWTVRASRAEQVAAFDAAIASLEAA